MISILLKYILSTEKYRKDDFNDSLKFKVKSQNMVKFTPPGPHTQRDIM